MIIKHVTVYQIHVTDDVIGSKLAFVIFKEQNVFCLQFLEQKFLNELKSLGGNATMLII